MPAPSPRSIRPRWGLRREALAVLLLALLLMGALALFAASAQRASVRAWEEDRHALALAATRRLARQVASGSALDALRRSSESLIGLALYDRGGELLATLGELPPPPPPGAAVSGTAGPVAQAPGIVTAWDFVDEERTLVTAWPAAALDAHRRGERRLLPWIAGLVVAIIVLVALFLRRLLEPYEHLLSRARGVGFDVSGRDEVAFLLETFERALEGLAWADSRRGSPAPSPDDFDLLRDALLPRLAAGLVLLDADRRILASNETAQLLLGDEGEALVANALTHAVGSASASGQTPSESLEGEFDLEVDQQGEAAVPSRRLLGFRLIALRPRASTDGAGAPRGWALLVSDRTEQRRQQSEQRMSEDLRRLGETAAGLAHELRNALATARGYLALVERRASGELDRQDLSEVRRELESVGQVVDDFLAFTHPDRRRSEELDVAQLCRQAIADPSSNSPAATIVVEEPLRPTRGDASMLGRALRNLVRNAVEAQEAESREPIAIEVRNCRDGVEVTIADRGAGIPAYVRPRLFEPFSSGRSDGVGMGLALARRIVDTHSGQLSLEDRPGGGTVARLWLPRSADTI